MATLGEEYPKEQARCRKLLRIYKDLGPVGAFGYAAISDVIARADRAAVEGDLPAMIRCFEEMRKCK